MENLQWSDYETVGSIVRPVDIHNKSLKYPIDSWAKNYPKNWKKGARETREIKLR